MDPVLAWPPILWLSRLLAVLLLLGITAIVILLLVRLAWREWPTILFGELPRLKTMRLLGQEFETSAEMDSIRDRQIADLERQVQNLATVLAALINREVPDVEFPKFDPEARHDVESE